jgi:hypothetical protein
MPFAFPWESVFAFAGILIKPQTVVVEIAEAVRLPLQNRCRMVTNGLSQLDSCGNPEGNSKETHELRAILLRLYNDVPATLEHRRPHEMAAFLDRSVAGG